MDKVFVVNRNNILRGNLPLTKILSRTEKAEDLMTEISFFACYELRERSRYHLNVII